MDNKDYCDGVPIRVYIDTRVEAIERQISVLDANIKLSVTKAESSLTARLDAMNEFRGSLNDLANRAATRAEVEAVKEKVNDIGKTASVTAALVAVVVSIVIVLLSRFIQ